ncbi:MAG: TIGR00366 family protein [Porticoccus sp.]|jgi:short-chain fatty acids transporter|uniref:short-chain fatty acid transporter n=1 Tax=Porticoccus sp. Uisw_050_02 TaxID=3230978 RepID=UPI00309FF0EB|tara:strand:- start:555 stop:1877 length:1323 start_codon:yes stop_codon:yes gene_type:complete
MIRRTSKFFAHIMERWLPDAFVIAIIITFIVLITGVITQDYSPTHMVRLWGDGVWDLLVFSMQVTITLFTGSVLAQTEAVRGGLKKIASIAKTPEQAIVLMTMIALICCWISWGFGLIASALMARQIALQVKGVHYPLLVASAYSGMLVWHAGLSASIPLKIAATDGDELSALLEGNTIPLSETIFSWESLTICLILFVTLPLVNRLMLPPPAETIEVEPYKININTNPDIKISTPANYVENHRLPTFLLGLLGAYYLVDYITYDGAIGLNTINFIFLVAGLLLHQSPASYLAALSEAVKGLCGVVLQFPLYAGIMGMMVGSGLAASMSGWFVSISNADNFTLLTFLSAGLVNIFVPSGGGQWAIQAPIVIPAAQSLGVPLHQAAMAVAFGDAWTNMIQPLWALPLLGIARLKIRDIMGYCTVTLIWSGFVFALGMIFLF